MHYKAASFVFLFAMFKLDRAIALGMYSRAFVLLRGTAEIFASIRIKLFTPFLPTQWDEWAIMNKSG